MNGRRYTKTFIETTYYQRSPGDPPGTWTRLPSDETPIDDKIRAWVESTGNTIVHPGQLGIHMEWHDAERTVRSVTLGQTVLYVEGASDDTTGIGSGPEAAASGQGASRERRITVPAKARAPARAILPGHIVPTQAGPIYPAVGLPDPANFPVGFTPTGTICGECGTPQYHTPSGDICTNGHGGAPAAGPVSIPERPSPASRPDLGL